MNPSVFISLSSTSLEITAHSSFLASRAYLFCPRTRAASPFAALIPFLHRSTLPHFPFSPFGNCRFYASKKQKSKRMAPKKEAPKEKILLGRPKNNLKSGIVGLANVGKSTLFQAITRCKLGNPANFPYATIDPEESKVIVPDERYDWLCDKYQPKSRVPAHLDIYDIAGLTKGASTGAGMGNAFLSHIRAVDAIFQVVRCFDDKEITHVEGNVDPVRDMIIVADELRQKDMEFVRKELENLAKSTRRGGQSLEMKQLKEQQSIVERVLQMLEDGKNIRHGDWSPKEVEVINDLMLLSAKPVVYIVNLSENDYVRRHNKYLPKIREWIEESSPGDPHLLMSIPLESRLADIESDADVEAELNRVSEAVLAHEQKLLEKAMAKAKKEGKEITKTVELQKRPVKSALPEVIVTMRKSLNLISFFTVGKDEVRQWTIRKGVKAPGAAGVIHTDFEKTFIQALVYNVSVLQELGDEATVKAQGKIMTKGKDYVLEDGDIILIKAGAAKA